MTGKSLGERIRRIKRDLPQHGLYDSTRRHLDSRAAEADALTAKLALAEKALANWMCGNCEGAGPENYGDLAQPLGDIAPEQIETHTCEHCRESVAALAAIREGESDA